MGFFKQQQDKKLGKQTRSAPTNPTSGSLLSQLELKLAVYKQELRNLNSRTARINRKKEMLSEFLPFCEGVVESNARENASLIPEILIFCIDSGFIDKAILFFEFGLANDLALPLKDGQEFKRDLPNFVIEEISNNSLSQKDYCDLEQLKIFATIVKDCDLTDEIRAKFYKALAFKSEFVDKKAALDFALTAQNLNPKIGLKNFLKRLETQPVDEPEIENK